MADPETGVGALAARSRALAVLRIRSTALGAAVLPAAVAVVLLVGGATGRLGSPDAAAGSGWGIARLAVSGVALLVLLLAVLVGAVISGARPALSPSVPVAEPAAPDLYRLVRDLADTLDVPAPSAIALTPDCDSWLEDRTHRAHGPPRPAPRRAQAAPVLVIGSPFLWWMRVGELRALLAPVVAGTGPSAHPDIAAARRFIRGLDAAVAVSARAKGLRAPALRFVGRAARLMLRACREHATIMERGVAAAASERAQAVDRGLRTVAQEQVGLAYAGWDRLLTRVALPAWRLGRWPSCLDVGVVSALTELSRRDRLAEGFTARLGERPACDLLEEPGAVDSAASLLAARLFHGGPAGPDWSPVAWSQYPEEVVDRTWRLEAARLHRVLDDLPAGADGAQGERTRADRGALAGAGGLPASLPGEAARPAAAAPAVGPAGSGSTAVGASGRAGAVTRAGATATAARRPAAGPTLARVIDRLARDDRAGDLVAARLGEELEREEHEEAARQAGRGPAPEEALPDVSWGDGLADGGLPLFPLQPPRTDRELLAEHVTAMVCCAAVDTAGAAPGLDWLDGPALLVDGARRADFGSPVRSLVEEGDAEPLRDWLTALGVRPEKPVRLV
ncbi:hypothetical protein [Streptomyces pinistramenti]|uniref:hypothetical protein n=1 Tax=Streptomyces pinistramenti TaxID=2884812 RepID=UPI001D067CAF|nr:hypothetical protein [Streptomyces pinistramenti]MCB5912152.1 hypothetical protein [Streptomyces pinistramenti]